MTKWPEQPPTLPAPHSMMRESGAWEGRGSFTRNCTLRNMFCGPLRHEGCCVGLLCHGAPEPSLKLISGGKELPGAVQCEAPLEDPWASWWVHQAAGA